MNATKSIADPVIHAAWDKHKTVKQNFQALGLVQDPNVRLSKAEVAHSPVFIRSCCPIFGVSIEKVYTF